MAEAAPSERAMLEAFFLWIYTARAHAEGFVDADHRRGPRVRAPAAARGVRPPARGLAAHDTFDRLPAIAVPTLVVAGAEDSCTPLRLGRVVAERIPGAEFVVLPGEAHQPFQERPDEFNELVAAFWSRTDAAITTAG